MRTRLPFRYGIAVMNEVPHVWLELLVTINGRSVHGQAADHLPPKWFTKDPARAIPEEIEEMRLVLRQASRHAAGLEGESCYALISELYRRQRAWAQERGLPPLLANFGPSLVERALLDAWCRREQVDLATALRRNAFGIQLGELHPSLAATQPAQGLPAEALASITCRHTVGLADPLDETPGLDCESPDDGLPVSLARAIRAYGLREFKVKVTAGPEGQARWRNVAAVLIREVRGDFSLTLDGNETFDAVGPLREFWERARRTPELAPVCARVRFIEQPFSRQVALDDAIGRGLREWPDHPPLLIDESGAEPADLRRALELGYAGVSHKNCKGVLYGVANACLLRQHQRAEPRRTFIMSGEDLANTGPLALPQDLAVQAALGNRSVERNGQHYFAGLSAWPREVQDHVSATYPELYDRMPAGWPTLAVRGGELAVRGVNTHAFGGARPVPMPADDSCWFEI